MSMSGLVEHPEIDYCNRDLIFCDKSSKSHFRESLQNTIVEIK